MLDFMWSTLHMRMCSHDDGAATNLALALYECRLWCIGKSIYTQSPAAPHSKNTKIKIRTTIFRWGKSANNESHLLECGALHGFPMDIIMINERKFSPFRRFRCRPNAVSIGLFCLYSTLWRPWTWMLNATHMYCMMYDGISDTQT